MVRVLGLLICFVVMLTSSCFALPQPWGEITKDQVIQKFFADRELDAVEGIWLSIPGNGYEVAITKNVTSIFQNYEYVGVVLSSDNDGKDAYKRGEMKVLLRRTADPVRYPGIWFMGDRSKQQSLFFVIDRNTIELSLPTGPNGSQEKQLLLRSYPNGEQSRKSSQFSSSGTGFIIGDRLIATNYHVVQNTGRVEAILADGTTVEGKIIASDKTNDVAILRLDGGDGIRSLPLGNPRDTRNGEIACTIGFPLPSQLGNDAKVSNGLISSTSGFQGDLRYFQISLPVQPGNSGGPLFDSMGRVVGVVTSQLSSLEMVAQQGVIPQNVNFAIKVSYLVLLAESAGLELKYSEKSSYEELSAKQIMDDYRTSIVYIKSFR